MEQIEKMKIGAHHGCGMASGGPCTCGDACKCANCPTHKTGTFSGTGAGGVLGGSQTQSAQPVGHGGSMGAMDPALNSRLQPGTTTSTGASMGQNVGTSYSGSNNQPASTGTQTEADVGRNRADGSTQTGGSSTEQAAFRSQQTQFASQQ